MRDRIVFFVLGALLATIAYFAGDMNNLSAQGEVTHIEKLSVGELTVDKTLIVGDEVKCHRLFRPQFRKFNPSFVSEIP